MFQFEANNTVIVKQQRALEAALSTNPKTQTALRKLINKVLKEARDKAVKNVRFKSDPRAARESIRRTTYKKILGANLNIYNSRKAGKSTSYEPPRKLDKNPYQRGGNRMKRSDRTNTMMHYGPHDRGMILRWQNSGTKTRTSRIGNRGSIAARNFFRGAAEPTLVQAADNLANLIESELAKMLNKTN